MATGRWIHNKCTSTAKLQKYLRELHKKLAPPYLITKLLSIRTFKNSKGVLENSLITAKRHRRHWYNGPRKTGCGGQSRSGTLIFAPHNLIHRTLIPAISVQQENNYLLYIVYIWARHLDITDFNIL